MYTYGFCRKPFSHHNFALKYPHDDCYISQCMPTSIPCTGGQQMLLIKIMIKELEVM